MHVGRAKRLYAQQIEQQIGQLLTQQDFMLKRLGKRILLSIQQHNVQEIVANLRMYEDLCFALAKQDLSVPVSIFFVSLSAHQQVLSSSGMIDESFLAPDEKYYMQAIEEPNRLHISKAYIKSELPEFSLLNWGIGVQGHDKYYGQLDAKLSLDAIYIYLQAKIPNTQFFSYQLTIDSGLHPVVTVQQTLFWYGLCEQIFLWLSGYVVSIAAIFYVSKARRRWLLQKHVLQNSRQEIANLHSNLQILQLANEIQQKYGTLALTTAADAKQIIDIHELLRDMHAVNAEFAIVRGVQMRLPNYTAHNLKFCGNMHRIMQILSGILYEIIYLLAAGSNLEIQVVFKDYAEDKQQLIFKFIDNGYYAGLQDRQVVMSNHDVRCFGWSNIYALIALENGTLEHTHVAYVGNTITLILPLSLQVTNNVVNLFLY